MRREHGFRPAPRRALAIASLVMSAGLLGVGALSATAAAAQAARPGMAPQQFQVAASVKAIPAERDDYGVTEFTPVQWPVDEDAEVSSSFGYRPPPCAACSSDHQGVDWTPGEGAVIPAIAPGRVVEIGNPSGALGVYAIVEHDVDGVRYRSVSAHMQHGSLAVAVGDTVEMGQELGRVGNTGTSTGAHLHFGVLDAEHRAVDPIAWLEQHATE